MNFGLFIFISSSLYAGYDFNRDVNDEEIIKLEGNPLACFLKQCLNPLKELTAQLPQQNIEVQIEFHEQSATTSSSSPQQRMIQALTRRPKRKEVSSSPAPITSLSTFPTIAPDKITKEDSLKRPVNVGDLNKALDKLEKRLEEKMHAPSSAPCGEQKVTVSNNQENDDEEIVQILLKRGTPRTTLPSYFDVYITVPNREKDNYEIVHKSLISGNPEAYRVTRINKINENPLRDRYDDNIRNQETYQEFTTRGIHLSPPNQRIRYNINLGNQDTMATSAPNIDYVEMQRFSKRATHKMNYVPDYRIGKPRGMEKIGKGNYGEEKSLETDEDHVIRSQDYINGMISAEKRAKAKIPTVQYR